MKKILNYLTSIIFPRICSSCGITLSFNKSSNICDKCLSSFKKNEGLTCRRCSLPLDNGGAYCYDCKKNKDIYFDELKSPYIYEGNIRKIIKKFKYSDRIFLSKEFSKEMSKLVLCQNWGIDLIIPVPLHFVKEFRRGYNQAYLLAKDIAVILNKEVDNKILSRKKYTKASFELKREKRKINLENVFIINKKFCNVLKNKNILLVDDIATTCTTINQCAKALKQMKAKKVFAVTVARAK